MLVYSAMAVKRITRDDGFLASILLIWRNNVLMFLLRTAKGIFHISRFPKMVRILQQYLDIPLYLGYGLRHRCRETLSVAAKVYLRMGFAEVARNIT
jgi:hypothetical protein